MISAKEARKNRLEEIFKSIEIRSRSGLGHLQINETLDKGTVKLLEDLGFTVIQPNSSSFYNNGFSGGILW